jgi:hypothetical protein
MAAYREFLCVALDLLHGDGARWERTGSLSARKTATGVRLFDLGEVERFTRRREGSIQADRGTRE